MTSQELPSGSRDEDERLPGQAAGFHPLAAIARAGRFAPELTNWYNRLQYVSGHLELAQRAARFVNWQCNADGSEFVWIGDGERLLATTAALAVKDFPGYLACVRPQDRQALAQAFEAAVRGGLAIDLPHRLVAEHGELRVCMHGFAIRDAAPAGQLVGILHVAGVGAPGTAVARQMRPDMEFLTFAEALGEIAWEWDLATDRVWWSDAIRDRLGYGQLPQRAADSPRFWLVDPDEREAVAADLRRALARGDTSWEREYSVVDAAGRIVPVRDHGRLVHDARGRPERMIGVMRDLTERRLLEDQLDRAQKFHAVGQLAGGIAHDFNNLLTVILGNADVLVEELDGNERLRDLADLTRLAARRGVNLTGRLLDFIRHQAPPERAVSVNKLVKRVQPLLARSLTADIRLRFAPGQDLPKVLLDPAQFEAALLNLVVNARDALPSGGEVRIETAREAGPDGRPDFVRVRVVDTGAGIPEKDMARVLEPFFTTKLGGRGTGLGLSIVDRFVRESGGVLRVRSEVGVGTAVDILLPDAQRRMSSRD